MKPFVSVIIPTYNSCETIIATIESLEKQTFKNFETIVVDDGSTDNTKSIVERFPLVYMRQNNQGPASARNRGIEIAHGDIIFLTDADCILDKNCINKHVAAHSKKDIYVVGGSIFDVKYSNIWSRCDIYANYSDYNPYKKDGFITYQPTANISLKKIVFEIAGYFDEAYPTSAYEDSDFCLKLNRKNFKIYFCPEAKIIHQSPRKFKDFVRHNFKFGKASLFFYLKNRDHPITKAHLHPIVLLYKSLPILYAIGGTFQVIRKWNSTKSQINIFKYIFPLLLSKLIWSFGFIVGVYNVLLNPHRLH